MQNDLITPKSYEELERFSNMVAKSAMTPKNYQGKPSDCLIAMMYGHELGLKPLQSLNGVTVLNGKPCVYGDTLVALCRASGDLECLNEEIQGEGDNMRAVCVVKRRDEAQEKRYEFSVIDAKLAKLWGKFGPWAQYPKRMLQMRARGFALRDVFADKLQGLITVEEARDYPKIEAQQELTAIDTPTINTSVIFETCKKNLLDATNKDELNVIVKEIKAQTDLLDKKQETELRGIYINRKKSFDELATQDIADTQQD